jgi:dTDP-4-amino-4,6-dideoxygalactose transaminase
MSWTVPLTDVRMTEEDLEAVAETLRSGWLTMGPRTQAFEAAIKEATTAAHAVAVSSGTAALHLACAALGLGPGDEVIVPAFTFLGTAHAPRYVGATPVLADVVAPECPNLDPDDVARRITARTKAVIAVHMCGYAADTDALSELCTRHGLRLIKDAAQAFGARVGADRRPAGTVGALGCLSSSPRSSWPSARAAWCSRPTRRSPTACGCCAATP